MKEAINYDDGLSRIRVKHLNEREDVHEILLAAAYYNKAVEGFQKMLVKSVYPDAEIKFCYDKAENASLGIAKRIKRMIKGHLADASSKECEKLISVENEALQLLHTVSEDQMSKKDKLFDMCVSLGEVLQEKFDLDEPPFIEPLALLEVLHDLTTANKNLLEKESAEVINGSDNVVSINSKFECSLKKKDIKKTIIKQFKGQDTLRVVAPINEGDRKWVVKSTITHDEYSISSFEGEAAIWKDEYMRGVHRGITCRDIFIVYVSYNKYYPSKGKPTIKEARVSRAKVNYDEPTEQQSLL
ncbi:hypothetical protein AB4505_14565 [Vibrio splendidus]